MFVCFGCKYHDFYCDEFRYWENCDLLNKSLYKGRGPTKDDYEKWYAKIEYVEPTSIIKQSSLPQKEEKRLLRGACGLPTIKTWTKKEYEIPADETLSLERRTELERGAKELQTRMNRMSKQRKDKLMAQNGRTKFR